MRAGWLLLAVALQALPAAAEMDASEYQVEQLIGSSGERARIKGEIAREIDREAELARRVELERERQRAEAAAAEARRPYPERLLQARCTLCHPPGNYLNQYHTLLGWHLVIARMRWLNRAPLGSGEQFVLALELARLRPAPADEAAIEYGLGAGAAALPALAGWAAWRWVRRRRRDQRPGTVTTG